MQKKNRFVWDKPSQPKHSLEPKLAVIMLHLKGVYRPSASTYKWRVLTLLRGKSVDPKRGTSLWRESGA